jgi:hypothetical protein
VIDSADNAQTTEESPVKPKRGAPKGANKGNRSHETHGIVTFQKAVQRRIRKSRSVIDRRCTAGKSAVAMRADLIEERGGTDGLSVSELTLIELIARDVFFVDEIDRRIFAVMHKLARLEKGKGRIKNPKAICMLYSYSQSVARNLSTNLMALGLQKPPPKVKTLQEILSESEEQQP